MRVGKPYCEYGSRQTVSQELLTGNFWMQTEVYKSIITSQEQSCQIRKLI